MPFTDTDGYDIGHFRRVYDYLIQPACDKAGFAAVRADSVSQTNYIMLDVLQKTINSDMVVCDLSGRNPNVLYELGIRQAFDRPVTLIKDRRTDRIFDIQGLRTLEYDESLRVDSVEEDIRSISLAIEATANANQDDVNSLISVLAIEPATLPTRIELSQQDSLVLTALRDIGDRLASVESEVKRHAPRQNFTDLYAPYLKSYSNSEASEQVNNIYLDPTTAPPTAISLSSGEMRVLKSMMDGISNQAIADREEWAVNTVRARVSSIMRKLRVQSRTEAIEKARRLGITA